MFVIEYVCGWTGRDITKLCHEDTLDEAIKNIEDEDTTIRNINYTLEVERVDTVEDCVDPCALMILYELESYTEGSEYWDNPDLYMKTLETKGWLLDGQPDHKRAAKELNKFLQKKAPKIKVKINE